jgi:hypothetical protein
MHFYMDLSSSLNVFDDGAVLLLFKFWTFSIVSLFLNHNFSRDGSSLVIRFTYSGGSGRWSWPLSVVSPTRVGAPADVGRAIPRNVVV